MDFQSAMETFAEAWVAANTQTPLTEAAAAEAQALAFTRSAESLSAPHDIMADKDSDHEFDVPRGSSLRSPHTEASHLVKSRIPVGTGKSIPVHCIVEQVPSPQNCDQAGEPLQPTVELDSYAIIPSSTLFGELVRTGLTKLGYTQSEAIGAKGAIHIKNWKPLSFDMITDDPDATVGQILGELTTVATLRIRLYSRVRVSTAHDVKEKLLQLLLTQSQSLLVNAGCPIDENLLSLISKGIIPYEISEDTRKRFDHWYLQQVMQHRQQQQHHPHHHHHHHSQQPQQSGAAAPQPPSSSNRIATPSVNDPSAPVTPPSQSPYAHAVHKTRMRTSFDPELELPKLHRWFAENQHPTRIQIQQYVRELNLLESRKGRKPLDVNNVVYWFKNARAAHKRAEMRQLNGGGRSPNHDTASSDAGGQVEHFMANGDIGTHDTQDSNNSGASLGRSSNYISGNNVPLNLSDPRHNRTDSLLSRSSEISSPQMLSRGREASSTSEAVTPTTESSNGYAKPEETTNCKLEGGEEGRFSGEESSPCQDFPRDLSRSDGVIVKQEPVEEDENTPEVSEDEEEELTIEDGSGPPSIPPPDTSPPPHRPTSNTPNCTSSSSGGVTGGGGGERQSPNEGYDTKSSVPMERMGLPLHPPSAELARSMIYMASYLPSAIASLEERRKRNRTFIDPVTEVPRLEQWFSLNTHPSHNLILKYTDELNKMPYRQKFPKLEPKNVQFWFKNRRAKCKRLKLSL